MKSFQGQGYPEHLRIRMVSFVCHKIALPRRLIFQGLFSVSRCCQSFSTLKTDISPSRISPTPDLFVTRTGPGVFNFRVLNRSLLHTSVPRSEIVQFHLSDIGEGIKEVTVKEWQVFITFRISISLHSCPTSLACISTP